MYLFEKIVCNAIVPPVSYWDYLDGDWKLFRDCKLQVPEGSEESYKESEGWEKFYHVYYTAQDNGFNYDLNPKTQTGTLKALDRMIEKILSLVKNMLFLLKSRKGILLIL